MSITGAKYLGGQFREQLAQVKSTLAKAGSEMSAAIQELNEVASHAVQTVQSVKAETADLKAALGLVSNAPPAETVATVPPLVELNAAGVAPETK